MELIDALSVALDLPEAQIVGFRDESGIIMTPSQVCYDPEYIKNTVYDVLLKAMSHRFISESERDSDGLRDGGRSSHLQALQVGLPKMQKPVNRHKPPSQNY